MTIPRTRRRSNALVAAALVAGAIVFAAPPAAASTAAPQAVTTTCGTKSISKHTAPGVGHSATYAARFAGSVTLLQPTATTLKVTTVTPASGWLGTVVTGSGIKVHVGFQLVGAPIEQERFWARLNTTGTVITIVLQSCT